MDVRVFNPHAQSNGANELRAMYMYVSHENEKRRWYERRITEIELFSFTPLVFSVPGGMVTECGLFYQRLASMISTKRNQSYFQTLNWIRCSISFILLRSSGVLVRLFITLPIDLVISESDLSLLSVHFHSVLNSFYLFCLAVCLTI